VHSDRRCLRGIGFVSKPQCAVTLLVYFLSALSLPVRLSPEIFASARAAGKPGAMTIGCPVAGCCTAKCYLDEDGVHHCVSETESSCGCELSCGDRICKPLLPVDAATPPSTDGFSPEFPLAGLAVSIPVTGASLDIPPVTPPPRH